MVSIVVFGKVTTENSMPQSDHWKKLSKWNALFLLSKACLGMSAIKSFGYSKTGLCWNDLNQDRHYTHTDTSTHTHIWVYTFTYIHICFAFIVGIRYRQILTIVIFFVWGSLCTDLGSGGNRSKELESKRQFSVDRRGR